MRPGERVVTLYPSFPLHEDYATTMGATVERVEVTPSLEVDIDALVAATATAPRLVMFANPLNPVGTWLTPEAMQRVIEAVSPETLLVVDEAYAEYAAGEDYPSAAALLRDSGLNWVALRTFQRLMGWLEPVSGSGLSATRNCADFWTGPVRLSTPMALRRQRDWLRAATKTILLRGLRLRFVNGSVWPAS